MHLNWLAKIELRGRDSWLSILLLITVVRETEETIGFFVTFLSLVALQLEGSGRFGLLPFPPWLRLCWQCCFKKRILRFNVE